MGPREPKSSGPVVLVVAVGADGRGSFSADGGSYEVGSVAELDSCLASHGWQPQRVIFRLPDLDRGPGAQAHFCELPRDGQ